SLSTAALRTVADVAPKGVECTLHGALARLPAFNPDHDRNPLPSSPARLRSAIHRVAAIVFSTPEYAGALPGALKNLLDWTIGDDRPGSIYDKPVCWINPAPRGASGAYEELRTVLGYVHARIVEEACRWVPIAPSMVGLDGRVHDVRARNLIRTGLAALVETVRSMP
ncbi:MAG TPA: NADPH-dependent FMN reductase, partial [Acidimicrobiales bacterium]|nr:NADPH-dependent FMN reductase [Acidimicrobiales bacterium]